jgi:hypothetical protein
MNHLVEMEHLVCLGDVTAWPQGDFGSYPQRGFSSVTLPLLPPIFETLLNTEDVSKVIVEFDAFSSPQVSTDFCYSELPTACPGLSFLLSNLPIIYPIASFLTFTFILISY